MKQKLNGIYNLLMQIHTSGEDSYKMVVCLNTLKECIAEAEKEEKAE